MKTSKRFSAQSLTRTAALMAIVLLLGSSLALDPLVFARSKRHTESHSKAQLASLQARDFEEALGALTALEENGPLELWDTALNNPSRELRVRAWNAYQHLRLKLARNQLVPQVARIRAPADAVNTLAKQSKLEVTIWTSNGDETIAAASPRSLKLLRDAGLDHEVLYDSIAEWQKSRASGDLDARLITPAYQSMSSQVRIAVVDLDTRLPGSTGSRWLGDRENVLMTQGSLVAYLNVFPSDGSVASIGARARDEYRRRGFKLIGYYSPEEFADVAPRLFPGKNFEEGRRIQATSTVQAALAEGSFHSYEETRAEFLSLANSRPDFAQFVVLGMSFEGREIFALKISREVSLDDPSKQDVLVTGCHHAREWISVESPVYFANQLLSRYDTDDQVRYLVDRLQIWIVPIVNPDGLTYSQGASNNSVNGVRLWRKNRRPLMFDCLSSTGVDLNRNYEFQWRLEPDTPCASYCESTSQCLGDDIGATDNPNTETYRGPSPATEPEVRAIKNLIDHPNRRFRAQLDYHNYAQLVLYPWGYQQVEPPDASTLSSIAEQMVDAMKLVAGRLYRAEQAIDLYAATGSSTDYAYGANKVPAPFVVEMRPDCCFFSVPESEIPSVNRENWMGALAVFRWATGPPILESVKAYSKSADGGFSKLVYSAHWKEAQESVGLRQLEVDTRFEGIDAGPIKVHLQFSKPMNIGTNPLVTLGRDGRHDELTVTPADASEGWQKTNYEGDTWIGQTIISPDDNLTSAWRLSVSARDWGAFELDGLPASIAGYTAGAGKWDNYEDPEDSSSNGGFDREHVLAPTLRGDLATIFVARPGGGERLAGGDSYTTAWTIAKDSGFIPVSTDLLLSTDGGANFALLVGAVAGGAEQFQLVLPQVATTRARIRVLAKEGSLGNILFGDSRNDFTIGTNVGSAADITFVSSEKLALNWTDSGEAGGGASGSLRLIVNVKVTNIGSKTVISPFLRVVELSRGNVLLSRDSGTPSGRGGLQTLVTGEDTALSPGETINARMTIGVVKKKKFNLSVALFGVPLTGSIDPAVPVVVWSGKPKTR